MQSSDRIDLYESVLDTFLRRTREKGYVIFEVAGSPDEYVQYQVHGGRVFGEVGSRQWCEPEKPLSPGAVAGLAGLGFTGGGPERNFSRDGLPASAAELARLTDTVLRTAYGREDFAPVVRELNLNDVTLPRAVPFTRDMIAAHLRDNDIRFLRDEDGDFRVDLTGDDGDVQTVWFIAEGPGDTLYRISSSAHEVPGTRDQALERCNAWNARHRWPKAFVADDERGWRVVLCADLDLGPGVTRELFDAFTARVAQGMVGFWSRLATDEAAPADQGTRPDRAAEDSGDA